MTHVSLPSPLYIPWPVRAHRHSQSLENLCLLPHAVSKKGQALTFCYESMAFAVSGIVVFTLQTLWPWTKHSKSARENEVEVPTWWMEADTTGWMLSVNSGTLSPSWALDPVYFRLDTHFHVSWKSVLPLVPWTGWLIRGFSLCDVRHENVRHQNPFGTVLYGDAVTSNFTQRQDKPVNNVYDPFLLWARMWVTCSGVCVYNREILSRLKGDLKGPGRLEWPFAKTRPL